METFHIHGAIIIIFFIPFLCVATDIITPTQPLAIDQTLISSRQVFELGFFDLGNNNLYLGIWYRRLKPRTYVWVANRDAPVNASFAKLTIGNNGNINLVDRSETAIWSSNQSIVPGTNTVAQLLNSGNFVLRSENDNNPENYIWQSFDYPTDTLLPGMKLGLTRTTGLDRVLRSWKADTDPAPGVHSYGINVNGFPEFVLRNKETIKAQTGPWNGLTFNGTPTMKGVSIFHFGFHNTSDEIYYSFEMMNNSLYSRVQLSPSGELQRFTWPATAETCVSYWNFRLDICDTYGTCGPFSVCDTALFLVCKCLIGFQPRDKELQDGSSGCVRSSKMDCRTGFCN